MIFELTIDRKEVLRYLGHKDQAIDDNMNAAIDELIQEVKSVITPRYVYEYYDIENTENGVKVLNTNLILKGKDIKNHLKNSKKCVLMAVTLGNNIERKIRLYEKTSLTKALILDSCATTAVEEVCDIIEGEIKKDALKEDKGITYRYSPGYGDLPLDIQGDFLNVLNAARVIGLNVSENNLLFPRKSVTAIIGIVNKDIKNKKKSCSNCNKYDTCTYRREGNSCGA